MPIRPGKLNQKIGTSDNPAVGCGADLILLAAAAAQLSVEENLTSGFSACTNHTKVTLMLNADGTLDYKAEGSGKSGTAVLKKVARPPDKDAGEQPQILSFQVAAAHGWQQTPLWVRQGQQLTLSASGAWTVDHRNFSHVGPEGYSNPEDSRIFQGCKAFKQLPYGMLLARISDNGVIWSVGRGSKTTADTSGAVQLRIHDGDGCLGDNAGSVKVTVAVSEHAPN